MSSAKKMLLSAAGNAGGPTDVSDVFSTFLYEGNGSTQTITNNIDLDGEGGLVWTKNRTKSTTADVFFITDTERGAGKVLVTSTTAAQATNADTITGFTSAGFALGDDDVVNTNNEDFVSWTFRKAPKFFDMVTYEGNNQTAFTVPHNLGVTPGMIILKAVDSGGGWYVWHKGLSSTSHAVSLHLTSGEGSDDNYEIGINATDEQIYIDTGSSINGSDTYIAYLFAHHDGDGEFGPDGDQDIIYHGSYEGNGNATGTVVNLGWEPQWLLIKEIDASSPWSILDSMRGITSTGSDRALRPNNAQDAEYNETAINLNATGFSLGGTGGDFNTNNSTYIYTAIRAPMITPPAAATDVFALATKNAAGDNKNPLYRSGFPVDLTLLIDTDGGSDFPQTHARLTSTKYLRTNNTGVEQSGTSFTHDFMNGFRTDTSFNADTTRLAYMWKRAKGYFDVVEYQGTGNALNVSHSLGVVPEMMWVRYRNGSSSWVVYHKDFGLSHASQVSNQRYVSIVGAGEIQSAGARWNTTDPTSSVFSVNHSETNSANYRHIAFLFASLAGISSVGSVTHGSYANAANNNGAGVTTNVDCGFANGARFVLIKSLKEMDDDPGWQLWDSVRGIIAGNDPYIFLGTTAAQVTNTDLIDPLSSGFTLSTNFRPSIYAYYAIA